MPRVPSGRETMISMPPAIMKDAVNTSSGPATCCGTIKKKPASLGDAAKTSKKAAAAKPILRRLLTHTAGFGYESWNSEVVRYQRETGTPEIGTCKNRALTMLLIADPGTAWHYGISIDFLGKLVEAVSGQRLDDCLEDHIFAP